MVRGYVDEAETKKGDKLLTKETELPFWGVNRKDMEFLVIAKDSC